MQKNNNKIILSLLIAVLFMLAISIPASAETSKQDDPLVTLSYVNEVLKPQIIAEVLEQLGSGGTTAGGSSYNDISVANGKLLKLGADCEFIYRGGGATIITSSAQPGDGVTDMSAGTEFFSGKPLEFGHVYYASESEAVKYILITGERAYFTVRGSYEIG